MLNLKGMPEEWKIMLQNSSITLHERLQNPQAVIDALDFYHHQQNNTLSKYMYSSEKSSLNENCIKSKVKSKNFYSVKLFQKRHDRRLNAP